MKEKVRDTFNQMANAYEHSVDSENLYNAEYERPAMMDRLAVDLAGKRVLDAGCAAGWYTSQLLVKGAEAVAIDMSPEMVEAAKRRVGDKAQVMCLDLESPLPFEEESFDLILSSLTLHYLQDWEATFKEFQRILKPGGTFLFSVHHPLTDLRLLDKAKYFETELIVDEWKKDGKSFKVPFYRRPLNEILNKTLEHFTVIKVIEPQPTLNFKERNPVGYRKLMGSPNFLIVESKKNDGTI